MREIPIIGDPIYQIWEITETIAYRLGITNPAGGPDYFRAVPGKTAMETLREKAATWFEPGKEQFTQTILAPGQFYPRIARPSGHHPTDDPALPSDNRNDKDFVALARGQLKTLVRQLDLICQTVHPEPSTFDAYGHNLRSLLILACTEVEMHWRGILTANHFRSPPYTTRDYVLLNDALRLSEYAIEFPAYPWLSQFRPFGGWNRVSPTKSLHWYAAYNAVKHDREHDFARATLYNAFQAVSAVVVMMIAQFGSRMALGRDGEFGASFYISRQPSWSLANVYVPSFDATLHPRQEINYTFV